MRGAWLLAEGSEIAGEGRLAALELIGEGLLAERWIRDVAVPGGAVLLDALGACGAALTGRDGFVRGGDAEDRGLQAEGFGQAIAQP